MEDRATLRLAPQLPPTGHPLGISPRQFPRHAPTRLPRYPPEAFMRCPIVTAEDKPSPHCSILQRLLRLFSMPYWGRWRHPPVATYPSELLHIHINPQMFAADCS